MTATEKYLFQRRIDWIRETGELSDADLDGSLGESGTAADPTKRNPNQLTATGLVELLTAIIARSNRRLAAAAKVFSLDLERLEGTAQVAERDGEVDRVTANMAALERELSRRGPTAWPLTKWLLANAEGLLRAKSERGVKAMIAETVAYFEGGNAEGKINRGYAEVFRQYFDAAREATDAENKMRACCTLFAWDFEVVAERAAILEFDAGLLRTAATIQAVWHMLHDQQPDIFEMDAGLVFDLAPSALEVEQKQGWPRDETFAWIVARLQDAPTAAFISCPPRKKATA
jgi:hypothetical protein